MTEEEFFDKYHTKKLEVQSLLAKRPKGSKPVRLRTTIQALDFPGDLKEIVVRIDNPQLEYRSGMRCILVEEPSDAK